MEVRFQTKEESNKQQQDDFLKLADDDEQGRLLQDMRLLNGK